jgi:hypothetical protein
MMPMKKLKQPMYQKTRATYEKVCSLWKNLNIPKESLHNIGKNPDSSKPNV